MIVSVFNLVALLAASSGALAEPGIPSIDGVWPITPLDVGTTADQLGFATRGEPAGIVVELQITDAAGGDLLPLTRTRFGRAADGELPFSLRVALPSAWPIDGQLRVSASPVGADGAFGTTFTYVLDPDAPAPRFGRRPVAVRVSPDALLVDVEYEGDISAATLSAVGAPLWALRAAGGELRTLGERAFVRVQGLRVAPTAFGVDATRRVTFRWPLATPDLPAVGVVDAELALVGAFGQTVRASKVVFTDATATDRPTGLEVSPSPITLGGGYGDRIALQVIGLFERSGPVELSGAAGPRVGLTYASSDPTVVAVTELGTVFALRAGHAVVTAALGGSGPRAEVPVTVDDSVEFLGLVEPAHQTITGRGVCGRVRLLGRLRFSGGNAPCEAPEDGNV